MPKFWHPTSSILVEMNSLKVQIMRLKSAFELARMRLANSSKCFLIQCKIIKKNTQYFKAVNEIVTPYTGFIVSNYYHSNEIEFFKYSWLNPHSKRISKRRASRIKPLSVVYCQTDMLRNFAEKYLPYVKNPIILITGKWHLPGLEQKDLAQEILADKNVSKWFSQNQIFEDLPIQPFPYGVHIDSAIEFSSLGGTDNQRSTKPLIPFSKAHNHMPIEYREFRLKLEHRMNKIKTFQEYKQDLTSHEYVVCTPGDRPDTYRHWETLACGAIPICLDHANFRKLFGQSAVYVNKFDDESINNVGQAETKYNPRLIAVSYWRERVNPSEFVI